MEKIELGQLIFGNGYRDAVHIAIEPVITGEDGLRPGEHVSIRDGKIYSSDSNDSNVGIIDPFLRIPHLSKGEKCYILLYPNTITSIRHHWSHPKFEENNQHRDEVGHEEWFTEFGEKISASYYEVLELGERMANGEYITWGNDLGFDAEEIWNRHQYEFKVRFASMTGKIINNGGFTCCY